MKQSKLDLIIKNAKEILKEVRLISEQNEAILRHEKQSNQDKRA